MENLKQSKIEPFAIVKTGNKEHKIIVGEYVVSAKTFKTFNEAEKYIDSKPYDLILNTCLVLYKLTQNEKNKPNETPSEMETDKKTT